MGTGEELQAEKVHPDLCLDDAWVGGWGAQLQGRPGLAPSLGMNG